VQLGLRGPGRGKVHGGNVPGSLEDVGGRCPHRCVDSVCHVYRPGDKGLAKEEKLVLVCEGEVAECAHKDAHLGGMGLTHMRHTSRGANREASNLNALLSVGHPKEQGSLLRRGGGVPEYTAFARGFRESDGGGSASEFAVCQPHGGPDETYVVVEG
jgi:hypothetical protein